MGGYSLKLILNQIGNNRDENSPLKIRFTLVTCNFMMYNERSRVENTKLHYKPQMRRILRASTIGTYPEVVC